MSIFLEFCEIFNRCGKEENNVEFVQTAAIRAQYKYIKYLSHLL